MKVLISGCSGFLGHYIAKQSINKGYETYGIDIISSDIDNLKFDKINLLKKDNVNSIVNTIKPDYVYNLSALSDIDHCIEEPLECINSNIVGNAHLIEACIKNKVNRYVFASSVYASGNYGGFYATSKKSSEMLIKNYNNFYGLNYSILRYGTLFGTKAPITNSIKKYLSQAFKENKIDYTGDGSEIREYIHIEDAAKLSIDILNKDFENKTISITGNHKVKTEDLFIMINSILDNKVDINYNKKISTGRSNSHYKVSPHSYIRDNIYSLSTSFNRELGDSLIEILEEIEIENSSK
tara:strand:- start:11884 stop:12771 length:888 start_codon:yes stop_codon:yes gene_type:complete